MWLVALLACETEDTGAAEAVPVAAWSEGMWVQRSMTVGSGIAESLGLFRAERCDEAAELVQATYENSFEPELEVVIRRHQGQLAATQLELGFGLLRETMADCDDDDEVVLRIGELADKLQFAAERLDAERVILP